MKSEKLLEFVIILYVVGMFLILPILSSPLVSAQVVGSGSIDSGLGAYFRFDTGSGTSIIDSSGNGNVGTATSCYWTSGYYGNAIGFNGSGVNSKIVFTDSANFRPASGNFSWSFWCKPSFSGDFWVIDKAANSGYAITVQASRNVRINFYNASGAVTYAATSSAPLGSGTWSMVTINLDVTNGYVNFYVNGSYVSQSAWAPFALTTTQAPNCGYSPYYGVYAIGLLDGLRMYSRCLSAAEILTLYQGVPVVVTYDVGSTVSPNGTVLVGVDQNQTFLIGASSGYVPSTIWYDGVPAVSQSVYVTGHLQSSHTLYVTSQFIGGYPSATPFPTFDGGVPVGGNPDYAMILVTVLLVVNIMLAAFVRVPYLNWIVGIFSLLIAGYALVTWSLPYSPAFQWFLVVVSLVDMAAGIMTYHSD